MQVLFPGRLGNMSIFSFYIINDPKFIIAESDFFGAYVFVRD